MFLLVEKALGGVWELVLGGAHSMFGLHVIIVEVLNYYNTYLVIVKLFEIVSD